MMAAEQKKRKLSGDDEESLRNDEDEEEDVVGPLPIQMEESEGAVKRKKGSTITCVYVSHHVL